MFFFGETIKGWNGIIIESLAWESFLMSYHGDVVSKTISIATVDTNFHSNEVSSPLMKFIIYLFQYVNANFFIYWGITVSLSSRKNLISCGSDSYLWCFILRENLEILDATYINIVNVAPVNIFYYLCLWSLQEVSNTY